LAVLRPVFSCVVDHAEKFPSRPIATCREFFGDIEAEFKWATTLESQGQPLFLWRSVLHWIAHVAPSGGLRVIGRVPGVGVTLQRIAKLAARLWATLPFQKWRTRWPVARVTATTTPTRRQESGWWQEAAEAEGRSAQSNDSIFPLEKFGRYATMNLLGNIKSEIQKQGNIKERYNVPTSKRSNLRRRS